MESNKDKHKEIKLWVISMFIIENLRRLRAMEAIFYETVLIC